MMDYFKIEDGVLRANYTGKHILKIIDTLLPEELTEIAIAMNRFKRAPSAQSVYLRIQKELLERGIAENDKCAALDMTL